MESRAPGIDPKRLVAIFYVFVALALGIFLEKVLGVIFSYVRWNDRAVLFDLTVSDLIGYGCYVVAGTAALVTWRNPRAHTVSLEVAGELKKVTWPSFRETRANTAAVVIASFVAAIVLGFLDFFWGWLSGKVY